MHGLGCFGGEMLSTRDGNTFPHSHLSFNLNIFERYVCSKLPSKKVLGGEKVGFNIHVMLSNNDCFIVVGASTTMAMPLP